MIVEILKDYHLPITKLTRDNKPYTVQKAFVYLGGAFPQEIEIRVESAAHAYSVGKYTVAVESFQVNQYRKLELNNYRMRLDPLSNSSSKVS